MEKIKTLGAKEHDHVNSFQLREKMIRNILTQNPKGKYKTVEDY